MIEYLSIGANAVTIIGFLLSFSKRAKVIGIILLAAGGASAVVFYSRPIVSVHTNFTNYESGFYSGFQQKNYSFPLDAWTETVRNEYKTRDDDASEPRATLNNYTLGSNAEFVSSGQKTSIDFVISKIDSSQFLSYTKFNNTIEKSSDGSVWSIPVGWAGFQINTSNFYPAKELMITVDFSGLANAGWASNSPRFRQVTEDPETAPSEISETAEALLTNHFQEMKVVPGSDEKIWFVKIKNPPRGWVLVRWPAF